jgi:putative two-component system response regulator
MNTVHILAVDDEPFNLDLIGLAFLDNTDVIITEAINGQDALDKIPSAKPDVILLDLRMPVLDGIATLKILKADENLAKIPVIVVTANSEEKHNALKLGANDFLAKPIDTEELKLRTHNQAKLYKSQKELEALNNNLNALVEQKTQTITEALAFARETEYEISLRLGKASEYRDLETGMHIKRMSRYSALLGKLWGMDKEEEELLLYASPLHDIGKIGIPDAILLKPGKLDESEFKIMQQHAAIGGLMLDDGERFPIIKAGKIIATQHHEKFDGSGYPNAIAGDDIHIYAKIVAIADVFDALSSKRVYKDAFPLEKTLAIIEEGRGTHFDPHLLNLFFNNIDVFLEIKDALPDSEEIPHILNLIEGNK